MKLAESLPRAIEWRGGELFLLDQTRLPNETVVERYDSAGDVFDAIRRLKVRGAPAIGVAAAYGLCVALRPHLGKPISEFRSAIAAEATYLDGSRPTAVNLRWALRRMETHAAAVDTADSGTLYAALVEEAERIHAEDQALCLGIGHSGVDLITPGAGVLTHCNAGALATSGVGTATAPMYLAHERGTPFRVYADETRPLLQGARLTSWELSRAGVDVTLIADTMTASVMAEGLIDLVITGTDRVAANGDVANKIGTLGVAIMARHFGIPFYVACPSSTIDLACATGADIPIEERASDEITSFGFRATAPEGIKVRNPAFDVTPNALVAGLITERGILRAPYTETLAQMFGNGSLA